VRITSCRATVSNTQKFYPENIHCQSGKDDKTVTSQETCLFWMDNAFVVWSFRSYRWYFFERSSR